MDQHDLDSNLSIIGEYIFRKVCDDNIALKNTGISHKEMLNRKKFTLNELQLINKNTNREAVKISEIARILTTEDKDEKVLKIKKELVEDFGIQHVYLDNNLEFAQNTLEAMTILKDNNLPCPDQIIGTKYIDGCAQIIDNELKTIIISNDTDNCFFEEGINSVYVILHESIHALQPQILSFNLQELSEEQRETANNVSAYAFGNFAHEVHCELFVKRLLKGLSEEEEKLFQELGGTWQ